VQALTLSNQTEIRVFTSFDAVRDEKDTEVGCLAEDKGEKDIRVGWAGGSA